MSKDIFKNILNEIFYISALYPDFRIMQFLEEGQINPENLNELHEELKNFRYALEIDNDVIIDDEETEKIMYEGLKIYSLLINENIEYGSESELH